MAVGDEVCGIFAILLSARVTAISRSMDDLDCRHRLHRERLLEFGLGVVKSRVDAMGVVPSQLPFGLFFGVRQSFWMIGIIAANLLGSLLVGWRPGGSYTGYGLLGVLGVLSGWISLGLLAFTVPIFTALIAGEL